MIKKIILAAVILAVAVIATSGILTIGVPSVGAATQDGGPAGGCHVGCVLYLSGQCKITANVCD